MWLVVLGYREVPMRMDCLLGETSNKKQINEQDKFRGDMKTTKEVDVILSGEWEG